MRRKKTVYELNDVTVFDNRDISKENMRESAKAVWMASLKMKRNLRTTKNISGLIAFSVYLFFLLYNIDSVRMISLTGQIMMIFAAPMFFVFLIRKISVIPVKKDYFDQLNEESGGSLDYFCNLLNISRFHHELKVGHIIITEINEKFVEYDILYRDGQKAHRRIQMNIVVNWDSEKTVIRFFKNRVVFELCKEQG